jgi:hypothetical protein
MNFIIDIKQFNRWAGYVARMGRLGMGTEGDKRTTLKWISRDMHCDVHRWIELAQVLVLLPLLILC